MEIAHYSSASFQTTDITGKDSASGKAHVTAMERAQILPLGDAAVLIQVGGALEQVTVERVWSTYAALLEALPAGVHDIVPAYGSVLVRFDPGSTNLATIMACVRGALEQEREVQQPERRSFGVGVCFASACALDLASVAAELKMSPAELIQEFCAATYRVAFLGFTAGFPYLLGLPPRLRVNRLGTPRKEVPAGSVGIANGQCGIYPRATPGGWKILGRTGGELFDPQRSEPALFRPGEIIQFFACATLQEARIKQT